MPKDHYVDVVAAFRKVKDELDAANAGVVNAQDADGRWHRYSKQRNGHSCAVASLRIVRKLLNQPDIAEQTMQRMMSHNHDFTANGFGFAALIAGSSNLRPAPKLEHIKKVDIAKIKASTLRKPVICGVQWTTGGKHAVVVAGPMKNGTDYLVLDPGLGIQYLTFEGSDIPRYIPRKADGSVLAESHLVEIIVLQ